MSKIIVNIAAEGQHYGECTEGRNFIKGDKIFFKNVLLSSTDSFTPFCRNLLNEPLHYQQQYNKNFEPN